MTRQRIAVVCALALLTAAGFLLFPGHTWLQSDTQIYVPMLERIADPTLFAHEPLALRPHLTWTLYDETALGLRRLSGLGLREVLLGQQLLFRLLGLLGLYLLGRAAGLPRAGALLAAAAFGLGATVNGPAVLTVEYEPVPRGFAIPLLLAALGFAAHRRWWLSGALAAQATLYHPTSAAPFWACALLWALWRERRALLPLLAPLAAAILVLGLAAHSQAGETEKQALLGRIPPALEAIQKLRGRYNWISLWPAEWFWQYPLLLAVVALAWRRVREALEGSTAFFALALPLYGLAMVPLQYLLLDVNKWVLMPQFQPARAVLWITAMAVFLCAVAGWRAAEAGRRTESLLWWIVVFALPANGLLLQLFTEPRKERLLIVAACAALAAAAPRWRLAGPAAVLCATALIPTVGGMVNFPALHTRPLDELSLWARTATSKDDVFFFAKVGHGLQPGVFRANAQRAIYVDWKAGGQANLLAGFGEDWIARWRAVDEARTILPAARYGALGIDYVVVPAQARPEDQPAVFTNAEWAVLKVR